MAAKKRDLKRQEEHLKNVLRKYAQSYLRLPGVTSVGVGFKEKNGKLTDELCIQFTVGKKQSTSALESAGLQPLPRVIRDDDGNEIPVDVLERSYRPTYDIVEDPALEALERQPEFPAQRRSRQQTLRPGISVANTKVTAGTLGAIVFDKRTGQPYILSNWHVLNGPDGSIGDTIVQPGPLDDPHVAANSCGRLVRSHLGLAGDCAVASIEGRQFRETILELERAPMRVAKVNLGDQVVKSGRTTGVTHGIVARTNVVVSLQFGPGLVRQIGGFEIRPNPARPAPNGEVSMGGDSGSLWLVDTEGADGDIAVGLHFAGELDPNPSAEHALACNIHSVLDKLDVSFQDRNAEEMDDEGLFNWFLGLFGGLGRRNEALGSSAGEGASLRPELSLPIYGNWCGPGHGGGPAIDDLDAACRKHDHCYRDRGYWDCSCNQELVTDIQRALQDGNVGLLGRLIGPLIATWMSVQPCTSGTPKAAGSEATDGAFSIHRQPNGKWRVLRRH